MEFGYFTPSDNHYPNNPRSANQFVLEIREQAIPSTSSMPRSPPAWCSAASTRPWTLTYREACVHAGRRPGRAMCSYFIFIADDAKREDYGRQSQLDYFNHCVIRSFPKKPEDAPPTMQSFMKIVDILKSMTKESLSERSILLGRPGQIIDMLKKVEKAGIEEVILHFYKMA